MTAAPHKLPANSNSAGSLNKPGTPALAVDAAIAASGPGSGGAVELLEQQAALYDQLQTLSAEQGPLIEQGPSDALLTLLARRQGMITRLTKLDTQLQPFRARWAETAARLTPAQQQQAKALIDKIETQRRAIMEQDERDCERLRQAQAELRVDIERMGRAGNAARAYGPMAGPAASRFTDRRG